MFDFFDLVVVEKSEESSKDSADGGCSDKNLTGMTFVNCNRVHRVIFREQIMRVCGGRWRSGGSCKGFIQKWHSIVNNTIKDRLIKITFF